MKLGAYDEGLRKAIGRGLHGVADRDAELGAISQQAREGSCLVRRSDHQHVADPGEDQRRQGVIDHRLVVDRNQLLANTDGDWMEPGARAARQDDASHGAQSRRVSRPLTEVGHDPLVP